MRPITDCLQVLALTHKPALHRTGKTTCEELGVGEYVHFIHNDAAGYIDEEKYDVAACVGATLNCGRCRGDNRSAGQKPPNTVGIILIGEPYWRQIPQREGSPTQWRLIHRDFSGPARGWSPFRPTRLVLG